jgi:3-hydroxymyristoyl/3-hydroxydecanoyl-(acyl carrier protein) dehydratase
MTTDEGHAFRLVVPPDLRWFDGHFPGDPIVPAVVQVDWAIHFGCELGFDPDRFSGFSRLKFKRVITPNTELRLVLTATTDKLGFLFESADGIHSQGTVLSRGQQ